MMGQWSRGREVIQTFLDDLESLLGELFAGERLGYGRDSQAFASVLLLVVAIVFAITRHGEKRASEREARGENSGEAQEGSRVPTAEHRPKP